MRREHDFMIVAEGLTKKYKEFISLDDLNLQVSRGEIFGFLGHNGAGKTTTVNILTTLLSPTSGRASICGFDIQDESRQVRERIDYLPENVKFYEDLTAFENLAFFCQAIRREKSGGKNQRGVDLPGFSGD
ncbi:putative ABC transporter ATP-binding protein YbhF [bacterium BMS3Abin14]|nr:putative ABC transporter ATP-binding protein YbhF [bacterium BMS3Abin14]